MSRIVLVVAMSANRVIGARGRIPWHIPDDMHRFRRLTMGKPCIMGRKTWASLPKKPLPGRLNIVLTHETGFLASGAAVAHSFEEAVARGQCERTNEITIIGGAEIYCVALPSAERIYLTEVHAEYVGEVFFPPVEPDEWREAGREEHATTAGPNYAFVILERIRRFQ